MAGRSMGTAKSVEVLILIVKGIGCSAPEHTRAYAQIGRT
jgi:hypothetical protein